MELIRHILYVGVEDHNGLLILDGKLMLPLLVVVLGQVEVRLLVSLGGMLLMTMLRKLLV